MNNKKIVVALSIMIIAFGIAYNSKIIKQTTTPELQNINKESSIIKKQDKKPTQITAQKKYDLYTNSLYDLPFISIYEISSLPEQTKKIIDELLEEAQGFYILRNLNDRILVLLQNPVIQANTFPRHDLQFVEIFPDGKKIFHNAGYTGIDGETTNLVNNNSKNWIFDKSNEPYRPLKHTILNEKGKTKFIEIWNYNPEEPIKYLMKDSKGNVLSILKESNDSESNYRREHIFYSRRKINIAHYGNVRARTEHAIFKVKVSTVLTQKRRRTTLYFNKSVKNMFRAYFGISVIVRYSSRLGKNTTKIIRYCKLHILSYYLLTIAEKVFLTSSARQISLSSDVASLLA